MDYMFLGASSFSQDLSDWCVINFYSLSPPSQFSFNSMMNSSDLPIWGTCPP